MNIGGSVNVKGHVQQRTKYYGINFRLHKRGRKMGWKVENLPPNVNKNHLPGVAKESSSSVLVCQVGIVRVRILGEYGRDSTR